MKKYKQIRLNSIMYDVATPQSVSNKNITEMKKKELMKVIRDHCTAEHIKATYQTSSSEFDFKKHKSDFRTPTVICKSENRTKVAGKYFNKKHYANQRDNEFKRSIADSFVSKVLETQRKVLLNYPPFKHFEKQMKKFPKTKYLFAIHVSNNLAVTIATKRKEWKHIFFYHLHAIGDLSKAIMAKEILANEKDKKAALLGLNCHQRGVEPYFPSTAFVSGNKYDYSLSKDTTMKFTDYENMNVDRNNDNVGENAKHPEVIKDKTHSRDKPKLFECTDDCIAATDEEYNLFHKLLQTFSVASPNNIRNIIDEYDYCNNMQLDNIYLLPCEKRNHSRMCYEQGCESSSVLIRKLAIHYKNCRRVMKTLTELNIAHKFIHDIDVAVILGDIDYLIKLVALPTNKPPSIFSSDCPPMDVKQQQLFYAEHIDKYKNSCLDLPEIVCQSCDILERVKNIKYPKESRWKHIATYPAWQSFKEMLNIENFEKENIKICNYCAVNFNKGLIPPRSKLNNMDPGDLPKEIAALTPLELMFISKAKVFQTVIKLGAVGKNVPTNSRLLALKGNCIHMPLPLEHTIKQLNDETDFLKLPNNFIMTHQIKDEELLLRNLVNLDKVYDALLWLKNNNDFYKDIGIPTRPELLFSHPSSEKIPDPSHPCDLSASHKTCSDFELEDHNLESSNVCSLQTNLKSVQSTDSHMEVQITPADNCSLPSNEESVAINGKNQPTGHANAPEEIEQDYENNPSKMIQKLSSPQIQNMLEHYSVIDNDLQGKSIIEVENLYELLKIDSEPLSYKEKYIDIQAFPNIFPYGKAGQNSDRLHSIQPKMFEKTMLLSGRSHIRTNKQYIFYCRQNSDRKLINQGIYSTVKNIRCLGRKNVGQLLHMMKQGDNDIERNLNRVTSKLSNSSSYWNTPRSQLRCLSETFGPATFFITFSPAEYDWLDMHTYLKRHNDLATISEDSLSTMDPVLTSTFIHQKFQSIHAFILESNCLGIVDHWFWRIEYQSRGTPHFHCMFGIRHAPIIGQSSDEEVMKFINQHITCELPDKRENMELYELVKKYQCHSCGNYCLKAIKLKTGKFCKACRFGFPRRVTTKWILYDVVDSIVGRKSSNLKKRLYTAPRKENESRINDYNKLLLSLWQGNMDIQFISENSYSIVGYITKYVTKADKSHLSNDDLSFDESIIPRLWKFAYNTLKTRELGAYEAVDTWIVDHLYACSDTFKFVSTVFSKYRTKMMKNLKDLEKEDPESTDIFNKDMLSSFYPERPDDLENMSLKDYAARFDRTYPKTDQQKQLCIKLKGDNGFMKRREKEALIYHNEFDPHIHPEKYYFSLLLLLKPWRKEADLLGNCTNYKEAFEQNVTAYPQLQEYDKIKQKIMNSKKKIEDEVSKKIQKIEDEGLDSEPEENDTDDGNALDQALNDFEGINNVDSISTQEELNAMVETLNPEQRRIYDRITEAIGHSVLHAIKKCTCDNLKPLLLYVSGFGGTGKSYLIKTIMAWAYVSTNVLKEKCKIVLAAPTGISAAGINGMTLHSALSLPIEHHGKMNYKPLTGPNLQQIQACMRYVHCVMIDEISMVSNLTLLHVHLRLTEIFGHKKGNDNWFGSQNVIVFGDLLQLPPVKGDEVFVSLSEKQVKAAIGMMSTNLSLWSHFDYDELTINQRQKNDNNAEFKDCLSRIRLGIVLPSDVNLLSSRRIKVSEEKPMESLVKYYNDLAKDGTFPVCLLPTRSMVREFNDAVLASRSKSQIVNINAIDEIDCKIRKMKENAQQKLIKMDLDDRNTAGLESCLRVSLGTRVMLRRNIDTGKKLVNGSTGTIINLKFNQYNQVQQIVIQFDGISEPFELNRDKRKIRIFDNAYVYREQFPLTCAYSITIHKSQGLSLKCVMADLGDGIFSEGQIYVALSRVQSLSGLHLININFNKIKASPKALQFYTSVSKQDYGSKQPKNKSKHSEVVWYTVSKRKKQAEMIKSVIDEEIKKVPSKDYKNINKTNEDRNISTLPKQKRKMSDIRNEPTSPTKKLKVTIRGQDSYHSTSPKRKCKNPDMRNEPTLPIKKLQVTTTDHGSHHSSPRSPNTWYYNPVDINWQQERADSLGLKIFNHKYVLPKESRDILINAPFTHTHHTEGDGNCFFRAISMYLTGTDDSHIILRAMVTDHMVRNKEQFLKLKNMVDRPKDFDKYIHQKKSSYGRRTTSNWADEDIIIATSSLLKTPIVSYASLIEDRVRQDVWCIIEGNTHISNAIYDSKFRPFIDTRKQIVLNNLHDHFEPADFE